VCAIAWTRLERETRTVVTTQARSKRSTLNLTAAGAVAYCSVFPIMQVALVAAFGHGGYRQAGWALAATVLFMPWYARNVLYCARGVRPPHGVWTFVAVTVIILGALPLTGTIWLPSTHVIAVYALIVLRPRWSLPVLVGVVLVQLPYVWWLGSTYPSPDTYYASTALWRTSAVFAPIWLLGAIRQLDTARRALAHDAVVRERLEVDEDLRRTLGTALARIAETADRAATSAAPTAIAASVREIVDDSRRTLADARRTITKYHHPSLGAELSTAAALLSAAGIETALVLPASGVLDSAGAEFRAEVRSEIAALLRESIDGACTITLRDDGGLRLVIDKHPLPIAAVEGGAR
jgi:two-component system sensor histidine kinase DesK